MTYLLQGYQDRNALYDSQEPYMAITTIAWQKITRNPERSVETCCVNYRIAHTRNLSFNLICVYYSSYQEVYPDLW